MLVRLDDPRAAHGAEHEPSAEVMATGEPASAQPTLDDLGVARRPRARDAEHLDAPIAVAAQAIVEPTGNPYARGRREVTARHPHEESVARSEAEEAAPASCGERHEAVDVVRGRPEPEGRIEARQRRRARTRSEQRRSASRERDEALHEGQATMAVLPGGVPER